MYPLFDFIAPPVKTGFQGYVPEIAVGKSHRHDSLLFTQLFKIESDFHKGLSRNAAYVYITHSKDLKRHGIG